MKIEVLLTPGEQAGLRNRDLSGTTCVVFDVLRATSTMLEGFANGAEAIVPVCEIEEAVKLGEANPDWLLAGERDGVRITKELTGSADFNLGNSPREFCPEVVKGKTIVMTTTNGTRALKACEGADRILVGAFLNLDALIAGLVESEAQHVLLVCAGTGEDCASEDVLCAGAVVEGLAERSPSAAVSDSALVARACYRDGRSEAAEEPRIAHGTNGRRLEGVPGLAPDVAFCSQTSVMNVNAGMDAEGIVRRVNFG